jgi:hypothetical protein
MTTLPSSIRRRPVSRWNSADIDIPAMRLLVWIGLFNIMLSVFDGKAMQQRRTKSCSRDR